MRKFHFMGEVCVFFFIVSLTTAYHNVCVSSANSNPHAKRQFPGENDISKENVISERWEISRVHDMCPTSSRALNPHVGFHVPFFCFWKGHQFWCFYINYINLNDSCSFLLDESVQRRRADNEVTVAERAAQSWGAIHFSSVS